MGDRSCQLAACAPWGAIVMKAASTCDWELPEAIVLLTGLRY